MNRTEGFEWTDATQAYLEDMARDGMSGGQIAKVLGLTRSAVLGRCHRTGVHLHGRPPAKPKRPKGPIGAPPIPDHVRLVALAAYFAGAGVTRAAAEAGVSVPSIYTWLKTAPALCGRARAIAFNARHAVGASTVEKPRKAKSRASETVPAEGKKRRGFAAMSLEKRREIAAKGGAAIRSASRAFSKDRNLAREAGRKGGLARSIGHGFA